jgi:hypothetical protein
MADVGGLAGWRVCGFDEQMAVRGELTELAADEFLVEFGVARANGVDVGGRGLNGVEIFRC